MDDFCREKGIKREYSVARTPQQNGVAERRNRTLIEAARTMLADSKLPTTFWAEAVSIACYVSNKGFSSKFDGKSDEGFFVGYSLSSKAFRVYNTRTKRVEENLHIGFLENKPMIEGTGPKWLFDIDSLTQSMNYVPVSAGTVSNISAGTSEVNSQECIVMPIWKDPSYFDSPTENVENGKPKIADDTQKQDEDGLNNENAEQESLELNVVGPSVSTASPNEEDITEEEPEVDLGNITNSYIIPTTPNTRTHKDHPIDNVIGKVQSTVQTRRMLKPTSEQGFKSNKHCKLYLDSSREEAMQKETFLQFKLQQEIYNWRMSVFGKQVDILKLLISKLCCNFITEAEYVAAQSCLQSDDLHDLALKQFLALQVQTVNRVRHLQALVEKKRVIVTESIIRRDLHLNDAEGVKDNEAEVLDLQKAKDAQAKEIDALEEDPEVIKIREDLGVPEDASKQGRSSCKILMMIVRCVPYFDETQERQDDDLIFDTRVLDDVEMPVEAKVDGKDEQSTKKLDDSTAGEAVTTADDDSAVPTTNEEITLAQTLIQIKAAKPKVVTTADTTTTTTRPKDKGVVVQEPSEFRVPQEIKPSSSKDKGKGIMIEPEVPLKRKDQIALDEQIARDIQAKLDAELLEEQKLARKTKKRRKKVERKQLKVAERRCLEEKGQ
ncbi:putative ribonuclease H-like domain-containing protein [Tanacetum coccineum]